MKSEIKIMAAARVVTIDIDGTIGVPEEVQFDNPEERVATYERFEKSLRSISEIAADRVVVNIRSTGGDVNDALLIYDALSALGVEVTTRCYGYAASAATIIAQAASKGCREISSNSLYLIHCCESACEGNAQSLSATKELLDKSDARIAEIYSRSSGRPVEEFTELMNRNGGKGHWLTPKESLEAGLVDRIIEASPITDDAARCAAEEGLPPLPRQAALSKAVTRLRAALRLLAGSETSDEAAKVPLPATTVPHDSAAVGKQAAPSALFTARPTETALREDPSIGPAPRSANRSAYDNDMENIRNS